MLLSVIAQPVFRFRGVILVGRGGGLLRKAEGVPSFGSRGYSVEA